ncbi:MAG TPA: sulfite exporter TauE/SafE family protein [Acidimicrobiales bacterium]|nr:sulfite exporter TauE/SafE family protein [Acidimicrobiales bacterium]
MDTTPLNAVLTLAAGVVTGMLSGAFGIGGAAFSTPAIRVLGVPAALAVGTTLPSILPSALAGTVRYVRESLVWWRVVAWTAPAGVVCAVLGSLLSSRVPGEGHWLMIATAGLLAYTSWRMVRPSRTSDDESSACRPLRRRDNPALLLAVGAVAGLLSGLLGVGGGTIMVPGFSELARIPLKTAIACSLICVGIFAVPATLTHWSLGDIDWLAAGLLSVGVVPGARLGAALAIRASARRLRLAVAGFLGAVAVVYAVGEMMALSR